ncbi:MAG TPA: DUF1080 domain-containing protein [Verrucomicrobiota bacterium]|nr:DUF1080 domain-containing protein [Verrucomicrobiota bacterium]HOK76673.1 DUF1080 domain-containing protein [Verrucomicrobiota bacterium]
MLNKARCYLMAGAVALLLLAHADDTKGGVGRSIFNGKDLAGWVPVHDVTFEVKDGNLRLVKGMGWLRTDKEYEDFILEFEWRALEEKYDSGIFLRAGLEGKPWPKDGWQVNLRYDALGGLVKGFKSVVPAETPKMPVNKWVKFRIEARGNKLSLDVDGERAWETEAFDATKGYIGIQAEDKSFDFRNIRVIELPRK